MALDQHRFGGGFSAMWREQRFKVTRRRVVLAGGTVLALTPLVGLAQRRPDGQARIGMLPLGSPANSYDRSLVDAFRQGLREAGLVENQNIEVDVVWVRDESDYPTAVDKLVRQGVNVLITAGTSASVAAKHQTSKIPIVFTTVGDPVGVGLVKDLSHPGGNATGFSD